eukprot:2588211-Prorocentrum_lima.AAC.1
MGKRIATVRRLKQSFTVAPAKTQQYRGGYTEDNEEMGQGEPRNFSDQASQASGHMRAPACGA